MRTKTEFTREERVLIIDALIFYRTYLLKEFANARWLNTSLKDMTSISDKLETLTRREDY